MTQARERLTDKWLLMALTVLVYVLVAAGTTSLLGPLGVVAMFFIAGPLSFGLISMCLAISRGNQAKITELFQWFKTSNTFWRAFWLNLLLSTYIFLWTLLLIVPGIMAVYSYSLSVYILNDNPGITANEAIFRSKKIMYGHRWRLFCLQLRFIGWTFLCYLTAGIGFFWLAPYVQVAVARFYDDLMANEIDPQVIF